MMGGVTDCRVIRSPPLSEERYRGNLTVWDDLVPFRVTRANLVHDVPEGVTRGHHAHQRVHEFCVAVSGSLTIDVEDSSGTKSMHICSPSEGAYIAPGTWITLRDFAMGTILLVLCSGEWEPTEVIRTRAAFDAKYMSSVREEPPAASLRRERSRESPARAAQAECGRAEATSSAATPPARPFIPVNAPLLRGNEKRYVTSCLDDGWISSDGPFVRRFERQMAEYCGRQFACAVTNGTAALDIAVDALGICAGDEVIVPALAIISCVTQIARCGATPVVVDCDSSFNMDASLIGPLITPRTRAILLVHTYHFPADVQPILALAAAHRLRVIEDAAELIGGTYRGHRLGSFGDVSTMSFYANKHVTAGEGGMLLTDDAELYRRIQQRRNLCFEPPPARRFVHHELGWNCRMTSMQAALGVAQLEMIEHTLRRKQEIGRAYSRLLADVRGLVLPPDRLRGEANSYWVYGVLTCPSLGVGADVVMARLGRHGIGTRPFFWPLHAQPVLKKMGHFESVVCPKAEDFARRGFYLPSGLALDDAQLRCVAAVVRRVMGEIVDEHASTAADKKVDAPGRSRL